MELSKEQMEETFENYFRIEAGGNYVYDYETKSIWVNGNVGFKKLPKLGLKHLTKLPIPFGEVNGKFTIDGLPKLLTLEGCPKKCRIFSCIAVHIKDLKHSPIETEQFLFHSDSLESLEGMPEKARKVSLGGIQDVKGNLIIPKDCIEYNFLNNDTLKNSEEYKSFLIKRELLSLTNSL